MSAWLCKRPRTQSRDLLDLGTHRLTPRFCASFFLLSFVTMTSASSSYDPLRPDGEDQDYPSSKTRVFRNSRTVTVSQPPHEEQLIEYAYERVRTNVLMAVARPQPPLSAK